MRIAAGRINLVLVLGLLLAAHATLAEDSSTPSTSPPSATGSGGKSKSSKPKKQAPVERLRVHVEAKRDLPERSIPATVGRGTPLKYNAEKLPILNEQHVENASLVDQPGGFQVRIQFNSLGNKVLESYTAAAAGRHLLILTDIDGETRWLAAPLVRKRIGDGTLLFSPDASREEMERLVEGLNHAVAKEKKKWLN